MHLTAEEMMRKHSLVAIMALACMLLSGLAWAQGAPGNASFGDWDSLVALLRSKGIEPSTVDWGSIDPLCIGLKTDEDDTAFNRCKYEHALLLRRFNAEKTACGQEAAAVPTQQISNVTSVDARGNAVQTLVATSTGQNPEAVRKAQYDACMQNRGWINPHDWTAGLSTPAAPR